MHLTDGELRRLVDEPESLGAEARRHVAHCIACGVRAAAIEDDAHLAARVLEAPETTAERTRAAYRHLLTASADGARRALSWPRIAAASVAAALVAALVVFGPVGSYASQLLTVFEPVAVAPVSVPSNLLAGLGPLSGYGDVTMPKTTTRAVAGATAAASLSGLRVTLPTALPSGLGAPSFEVLQPTTAAFTFVAAKAEATAARQGVSLPTMPASLNGSTLTLTVGPAVLALYPLAHGAGGATSGDAAAANALYVADVRAPVVRSNGAGAATIENYLLSLPGIPQSLQAELRALETPAQTLPVPIPAGEATGRTIQLDGTPAVAIADASGLFNAVVWETGGEVQAVAGPFTAPQVEAAAASIVVHG